MERDARPSRPHLPALPSARTALVLADVAGLVVAALLTGAAPFPTLVVMLLSVSVAAVAGLYRSRVNLSRFLFLTPLAVRVAIVCLVVDMVARPEAGLRAAAFDALVTAALVSITRILAIGSIRTARTRGWVSYPTLLIGTGDETTVLKEHLVLHRSAGLTSVGCWDPTLVSGLGRPDEDSDGRSADEDQDLTVASLRKAVELSGARVAIVSSDSLEDDQLLRVTRTLQSTDVQTFVTVPMPDLYGAEPDHRIDHLWDIPLLRLPRSGGTSLARMVKRIIDIAVSATALVLVTPIMAVATMAVLVTMGRPILFHQTRIGLGGHPIDVVKFRSVTWRGTETEAWDATASDSAQINAVGRFLRSTSIDELPQLFLVLRGSMSLVGPRPERPEYARLYAEKFTHYDDRHRVPAGLTGLSQVQGLRGDTSIEDRARFDNRYIDSWSLGLDLRILLRTIPAVLRRSGR